MPTTHGLPVTRASQMVGAYLESIRFTETGDAEQPPADAPLSALSNMEAHQACERFLRALDAIVEGEAVQGMDAFDWRQVGHDLWLTRNGHGTGFWERPEVYGEANAALFTRLAIAMGEHDVSFDPALFVTEEPGGNVSFSLAPWARERADNIDWKGAFLEVGYVLGVADDLPEIRGLTSLPKVPMVWPSDDQSQMWFCSKHATIDALSAALVAFERPIRFLKFFC